MSSDHYVQHLQVVADETNMRLEALRAELQTLESLSTSLATAIAKYDNVRAAAFDGAAGDITSAEILACGDVRVALLQIAKRADGPIHLRTATQRIHDTGLTLSNLESILSSLYRYVAHSSEWRKVDINFGWRKVGAGYWEIFENNSPGQQFQPAVDDGDSAGDAITECANLTDPVDPFVLETGVASVVEN